MARHIVNIFSKSVTQILLWVTLITTIYFLAFEGWPHVLKHISETIRGFWKSLIFNCLLTLVLIFYPLGGLIGDTCLGRYKIIVIGLGLVMLSALISSIASILVFVEYIGRFSVATILDSVVVLDTVSFILFVVAISALNSNVIQFGLDQLMERPSESMGVFVHWFMWALKFGEVFIQVVYAIGYCSNSETGNVIKYFLHTLPFCCVILLFILLLTGYCTRHHFNKDRIKYNPYKMIFKVINFARKNKYPVGPVSAFAYCSDFHPSRLDYAKERYGGPFTTSDVEDVRAFKNVFLVLFALGPIFILDIPITTYFSSFSSHMGFKFPFKIENSTCNDLNPETFTGLITLTVLPIYTFLLYSVFQNKTPKILHRLGLFVLLYIFGLVVMLLIDISGHAILLANDQPQPECMFVDEGGQNNSISSIHWTIVILPSALSECKYFVMATALEFVSAQSPHTMIGVLVGIFYALIGIFRFLGILFSIPFSLEELWGDSNLGHHPPVVSCGFGYYLVCLTVAVIGFISFIIAVKRYKYRRRDEEPYSQACVEEIFARRIANQYESHINRVGYVQLS